MEIQVFLCSECARANPTGCLTTPTFSPLPSSHLCSKGCKAKKEIISPTVQLGAIWDTVLANEMRTQVLRETIF